MASEIRVETWSHFHGGISVHTTDDQSALTVSIGASRSLHHECPIRLFIHNPTPQQIAAFQRLTEDLKVQS